MIKQHVRTRVSFREALCRAAYRKEAIRARIALIASERGPSRHETERALKGVTRAMRDDNPTLVFCRTHSISIDWLYDGNLRGLLRAVCIEMARPYRRRPRDGDEQSARHGPQRSPPVHAGGLFFGFRRTIT